MHWSIDWAPKYGFGNEVLFTWWAPLVTTNAMTILFIIFLLHSTKCLVAILRGVTLPKFWVIKVWHKPPFFVLCSTSNIYYMNYDSKYPLRVNWLKRSWGLCLQCLIWEQQIPVVWCLYNSSSSSNSNSNMVRKVRSETFRRMLRICSLIW